MQKILEEIRVKEAKGESNRLRSSKIWLLKTVTRKPSSYAKKRLRASSLQQLLGC